MMTASGGILESSNPTDEALRKGRNTQNKENLRSPKGATSLKQDPRYLPGQQVHSIQPTGKKQKTERSLISPPFEEVCDEL
jgi:hypothetical protein